MGEFCMRDVKQMKWAGLLLLGFLVTGCASHDPSPYSGIESSLEMRPNEQDSTGRIPFKYIAAPNWNKYDQIMLEPVVIYSGADAQFSGLERTDRITLANDMTVKFSEALGRHFRFTATPGRGTLRIRLTLTGAETTVAGLSTFSRFDIGMGSYNLVQAARDRKGTFTGSVSYAVEIYDASTSQLLESYVTRQYPKVYDISSTFGRLSAAQAGISRGADELVDVLLSR
ncbi:putative lipoprotein [Pseudomonas syringae pv. helianthi]|nr:putative lipoprotein [Pseudomonas syringae pv. helianthi]KPY89197.1 putative lipoprotein [Pseudomonas syringae pv. tagetis]RMW16516.1 putative lipoprotein [Pseudomonas syringae pv. tagetis]RMW20090.1 putative lipoprotein [Pseudomonas syringae pv. tagetis]